MKILNNCSGPLLLFFCWALLWQAEVCYSFVPLRQERRAAAATVANSLSFRPNRSFLQHGVPSHSGSSSRLYNGLILILEEDDDDENNGSRNNEDNNNNNNMFDVFNSKQRQKKKQQLPQDQIIEFIIEGPIGNKADQKEKASAFVADLKTKMQNSSSSVPRPLTSAKRIRLETERNLLDRMAQDHGIDTTAATTTAVLQKLSTLWTTERGADAAKLLGIADALVNNGHPMAWGQAEAILYSIIRDQGVQWVAPIYSLATLYSKTGRLHESKELYEMVLMQKPWHWEALAGIHRVCRALNDYQGLGKWDRELLPDDKESRQQWAKRMRSKVQEQLTQAEQGLHSFFDSGLDRTGSESSILLPADNDDDEGFADAWQ